MAIVFRPGCLLQKSGPVNRPELGAHTRAMSSKLDYLQKYLSGGQSLPGETKTEGVSAARRKKKSKKKTQPPTASVSGFRIIDEASDIFPTAQRIPNHQKPAVEADEADEDERFQTQEERPQVAGYVDERPDIEIMKERFHTQSFQTLDPAIKLEIKADPDQPSPRAPTGVSVKDEPVSSDEASPVRRSRHDSSDEPGPHGASRRRLDSSDEDASPVRRPTPAQADSSPPRRTRPETASAHSSPSPPRRKRSHPDGPRRPASPDASPPRRPVPAGEPSPPRRRIKTEAEDLSPPRRRAVLASADQSPPRLSRTLAGKKAGLQDAKSLKDELTSLRQKERAVFDQLSSDISGRGAETQVRGRLKAKAEEAERKREENELTEEVKQKYSRWSKGVTQTQVIQERISADLYEMSKPLTRDADDQDLDAHLKAIERDEDPMLQFIKKKKSKQSKGPKFPTYQGPPPPPNRFGIAPGYRWDGVDRSSGFETKLFDKKNSRVAMQEEAYKWSTEDM